MKKTINKGTISFLLLSLFSCSSNVPVINTDPAIVRLQQAGIDTAQIFVAEVSKSKGASIYFRIASPPAPLLQGEGRGKEIPPKFPLQKGGERGDGSVGNGLDRSQGLDRSAESVPSHVSRLTSHDFSTKANTDGTAAKTPADIDHFLVYLIKDASTTGFPAGGDPLADVVAGPFNISKTTRTTELIRFDGIQPSNGGAYYVAVRARDSSNNDIIKDNNGAATAWANTNKKIAVSSGNGIVIDNNFQVSSTTALGVTLNLPDAAGAVLEAEVTPTGGAGTTESFDTVPLKVSIIAGIGSHGYNGDNIQATAAQLSFPQGIEVDSAGNIYIADDLNHRIRKIDASTGVMTTFAGGGSPPDDLGDNGPATEAEILNINEIAADNAGNIYFSDYGHHRIRKVDTAGNITTVVGNGSQGYNGENIDATNAMLDFPTGVSVDTAGNLYIVEPSNQRVRKIDASTGRINTIAGTGSFGYNGTNITATDAQLRFPQDVTADRSGNVYIADFGNNMIRKVDTSGVLTDVAGTGPGSLPFNGDNQPATDANLSGVYGVDVDNTGNVYISSFDRVRRVDAVTGYITTVAGGGSTAISNDLDATAISLSTVGIDIDAAGNLFFIDSTGSRVLKVY